MQVQAHPTFSVQEYLDLENSAQDRHEYRDGVVVPMAGGMPNHNQIALNFSGALNFAMRGQPYRVFIADQRLWIPRHRLYTYPDIMVVAQPLTFAEGRRDTLINPVLIAEVLSDSTESYDRGAKFAAYRTIESMQEYLLFDQYRLQVEHYTKTNRNQWIFSEYQTSDGVLSLTSIPFQILLGDLYEKVDFEPSLPSNPKQN